CGLQEGLADNDSVADSCSGASRPTPGAMACAPAGSEPGAGVSNPCRPALEISPGGGDLRKPAALPGCNEGAAGGAEGSAPLTSFFCNIVQPVACETGAA